MLLIHLVIQKSVAGFAGIFIFAAGCLGQFARCIALHHESRREPSSWLASRHLPRLPLEPVLAQPLLLLQKSDSTLFCKCPQRQWLRLLQV